MNKKPKKNITISQKEHDDWHKKNKDYDAKDDAEHRACHKEMGIVVKRGKKK